MINAYNELQRDNQATLEIYITHFVVACSPVGDSFEKWGELPTPDHTTIFEIMLMLVTTPHMDIRIYTLADAQK
jgi:hypothetical protein